MLQVASVQDEEQKRAPVSMAQRGDFIPELQVVLVRIRHPALHQTHVLEAVQSPFFLSKNEKKTRKKTKRKRERKRSSVEHSDTGEHSDTLGLLKKK